MARGVIVNRYYLNNIDNIQRNLSIEPSLRDKSYIFRLEGKDTGTKQLKVLQVTLTPGELEEIAVRILYELRKA